LGQSKKKILEINVKTGIRKISNQRGASAIEFAIVLPLLILMLFGIIEFGILLYDKAMITNASREGARTGIVYSYPSRISDDEIWAVVRNYCEDHLITFGSGTLQVPEITRSGDASGDVLTVRVRYKYDFLVIPSFIAELAGGINLLAETVMRME
jgi:Flp pilus assembly protein TadG